MRRSAGLLLLVLAMGAIGASACVSVERRPTVSMPRIVQLCATPLPDTRSSLIRWDAGSTWVTAARCEPPVMWMGRWDPPAPAAQVAMERAEQPSAGTVRRPALTVTPLGPPRPVRPMAP